MFSLLYFFIGVLFNESNIDSITVSDISFNAWAENFPSILLGAWVTTQ